MTIIRLAYISTKGIRKLETVLMDAGFGDQTSIHQDGAEEEELWVEFDKDSMKFLRENGYVSSFEKKEMQNNNVDTILFY